VKIFNSKFNDNLSLKGGGAIYAESFLSLQIFSGSEFISNVALNESGDAIHLKSSLGPVEIFDSRFYSDRYSNFIVATDIPEVYINGSSFIISQKARMIKENFKKVSYSGLMMSEISRISIIGTLFKNLKSFTD
jgi:predicted outer membrane repeat protein